MQGSQGSSIRFGGVGVSERRFGALGSSTDPQALGDHVKGVILGAGVLIIFLAHAIFKVNLGSADITNLAIGAGTAVSSVWTAYGLIKEFVVWIYTGWKRAKQAPIVSTDGNHADPTA